MSKLKKIGEGHFGVYTPEDKESPWMTVLGVLVVLVILVAIFS